MLRLKDEIERIFRATYAQKLEDALKSLLNVGSSTLPVYFEDGVPKAITFGSPTADQILSWNGSAYAWINKPAANVSTSAVLASAADGKQQISANTNNPYYNLLEGTNIARSIQFKAGTNMEITTTVAGVITFNATNTWQAYVAPTENAAGTAGYITPPTYGNRNKFLRGDGTWQTPTDTKYKLTLNNTEKGTSGGTSLGTIYAPESAGTGFLKGTAGENGAITWSWDNSTYNNYSLPTASNTTKGGVKTGAAIESTDGYTAVHIKNGVIYYKDTDTWIAWVGATQNGNGTAGYMPAPGSANKDKFLRGDGTWCSLNNYSLPKATTSALGGIIISNTLSTAVALTSADGTTANRYYGVQVDKDGKAFVNIPWENTWTAWKGSSLSANGTAGYMPAPTKAQRSLFLRGDGQWVSLNNYSLPVATDSALGGVKVGTTLTSDTGYTKVHIKDDFIYYKDTTYSFSNLLFLQTSGTNLMTYNSQAVRTVLAGSNITFTHSNNILTIAAKNTTYSTVSKSAAGLCPTLPNETTTTKYLRLDGAWAVPPDNNTWKPANTSLEGYAPKLTTGGGTIGTQSTEYVLTFKSGTDSAPVWRLLPANAYNDHTYTVNNATYSIKSLVGSTTTTLSDFTANQSGNDDFTLVQGSNITFTVDATNRKLTIAGTANTWNAANASQAGYVPKSTANKILRADGNGALYWGDDANTTYTFYNLQFQNSGGTTVDTYKPTTSPTKTLKAGSNVTISAASNVITIASTNTWNANAVGVAGYVAAPTKAANANMTWLTDANGNPAWRASNNHSHSYLPLSGGTMNLGEGLKFHADDNYFGTNADARIISLLDSNDSTCDGGLIIDERGTLNGTTTVTELLRIRDNEFKWKGNIIYHAGNLPAYPTKSSWNYDDMYVASVSISGNNLRINKNGSNTDLTIPYATSAGSVAWANISSKPINFKAYTGSLASGGWKTMQGKDSHPSIAISYNNGAASWNGGTYSATLVYGCNDTRGLLDCAYNTPIVTFGGCSYGSSDNNNPTWYMKISGTNGTTYDLNSMPYATSAGNASTADLANMIKNNITVSSSSGDNGIKFNNGTRNIFFGNGSSGNSGIYTATEGWLMGISSSGSIFLNGNATSATSASKLSTPRTIWGQSFDGSASISGDMTFAGKNNVSYNYYIKNLSYFGLYFKSGASSDVGIIFSDYGRIGIGKTDPAYSIDTTGDVKANSFIKIDGTSSLFLKADGSIDSSSYATTSSVMKYYTLNYGASINSSKNIGFSLDPGNAKIHISNVEYSAVLTLHDYVGKAIQIRGINNGLLYYRTETGGSDWRSILDSNNSSVSKSGDTLTVKINGSSESITNTWRGILNNLTSTSTSDSLSAYLGYLLANGSARDSTKIPLFRYGTTGATTKIKININSTTLWMLCFIVTLYQNYRATKIMISGYQYGSSYWYLPEACILGDNDGTETISVYFGYDAVNKLWVGFDGGSYTGVSINDVTNGYYQISDFSDLFTISNVSSLTTLQTTVTAASKANYANSAGNADTVDSLHASNFTRFFLSPLAGSAPADSAKSWFTNTMPSGMAAIVYNVPGSEKTIIVGKSSGAHGHMLQIGYDDTYLRILRYRGGNWKSTDWEKISAGYADSAGNADTVDSQHFKWSNDSNSPTYLWAANSSGTAFLCARGSMSVNYANSAGSATYATYLTLTYCNSSTNSGLWNTIKNGTSNSVTNKVNFYTIYNNGGPTTYGEMLEILSYNANHWLPLLWFGAGSGGHMYYRNKNYNNNTWGNWLTILDSDNSSVSKSGETLTVKINGTSQSLTNTNTWRGILNNLTSTSTTDSLSAAQGKALNDKFGSYLPLSGGNMNGSINNNGEYSYVGYMPRKKANGGGWAYDIVSCRDASNSVFMHLGVYGGGNSLSWIYLGSNDYNGNNLRVYSNGNTTAPNFYTYSDRNKKLNITVFSEHVRKFQLKDTEKWHYGVIAQEVEEMFRDGEEGNMTVNYNSILSYYVGQLENRVKALEDKLKEYENKLK